MVTAGEKGQVLTPLAEQHQLENLKKKKKQYKDRLDRIADKKANRKDAPMLPEEYESDRSQAEPDEEESDLDGFIINDNEEVEEELVEEVI